MRSYDTATNPKLSELISSQGVPTLDALLNRYATIVHPEIYDCRACPKNYQHCPQQMIERGQGGMVWTLMNGCSDSRANPGAVFEPHPGDMFAIEGAGALLTDYHKAAGTNNAWGSIEYAVDHLGVKDLIQFGHTECGAMAGLVAAARGKKLAGRHLRAMLDGVMDMEREAESMFLREHGRLPETAELQRELEFHNVRIGTGRLREFVGEQYPDSDIRVHGWIYDMRGANILALQEDGSFKAITHLPSRCDYGALPHSCEQGMREIGRRLVYQAHHCGLECRAQENVAANDMAGVA